MTALLDYWPWFVVPVLMAVAMELLVRSGRGRDRRGWFVVGWAVMALAGTGPLVLLALLLVGFRNMDPQFLYDGADFVFFAVTALSLMQCFRTLLMLMRRHENSVVE